MKILILEDETLAAEKLVNMLKEIEATIEVMDVLKSVESAVKWFEGNDVPDLVISDIRLLDGLSFQVFKQLTYKGPVIFTTAYDQYAIKAFEVNSVDYLLKPVQPEKLALSLEKLRSLHSSREQVVPYDTLMSMIQSGQQSYKSRFMIRSGQKIVAIAIDKVAYFFSQHKLTYVVTHDDRKYPLDQPLEVIDRQLDPKLFFRANRQFIIKFEAIEEIHPYFKGRIKINLNPPAEEDIVISADKTPEFKKWLDT